MRLHKKDGKFHKIDARMVRGDGSDCCCSPECADCTVLLQETGISTGRKKSSWRGYPTSQFIFRDYTTTADTWGAYVAPDLDGFGQPIEGTGNPPYEIGVRYYYNRQTCHRLLISPFIAGSLDDQTGDFSAEYVLKTNACGHKPFEPCNCFGGHQRPFASSYNSQQGALLDLFPHWLGPPTTNTDCPALSNTGAGSIESVEIEDCPPESELFENCCRVGGYETGLAAVVPTWEWIKGRSWWDASTYSDARLVLVVAYMTFSRWKKISGAPATYEFVSSQSASDSAGMIRGAFISKAA